LLWRILSARDGQQARGGAAIPEPAYVAPPDRFPPRLASLGYRVAFLNGAEVILPPLCAVPAGPFLMGSDPKRDKDAEKNEQPQHWVTLGAFQIGKYPVTVAEYACFLLATARPERKQPYFHLFPRVTWAQQLAKRLDHPVVNVSWYDAMAFTQWLNACTGQAWRLPGEAEWEKAARGTDGRIYPWGDTFDASRCNTSEGRKGNTTPADSYKSGASPYGTLNMAGNVFEWTSSVSKRYPYEATDGREESNCLDCQGAV
jgi:formylglycine-generating enzyme required for sulfatase activity